MSNEQKHTPTPWEINDVLNELNEEYDGQDIIISHKEFPILSVRGTDDMACIEDEDIERQQQETIANAELIVRAVNNYEPMQARIKELEGLLKASLQFVKDGGECVPFGERSLYELIQEALQSSKQL